MFVTVQQLEQQMPDATRLLSDEPEMETSLHYMQLLLLVTSLEWLWQDKNDFFIGVNLTIYNLVPEGELVPTPEDARKVSSRTAKRYSKRHKTSTQGATTGTNESRTSRIAIASLRVRIAFS
ncbi:hypothetical protein NIES4101_72250 [Calothrix sp. NIES-4101]|nr:hypothetical protein NIES4101_72250 [Calothrix sp. NIES-4101]